MKLFNGKKVKKCIKNTLTSLTKPFWKGSLTPVKVIKQGGTLFPIGVKILGSNVFF